MKTAYRATWIDVETGTKHTTGYFSYASDAEGVGMSLAAVKHASRRVNIEVCTIFDNLIEYEAFARNEALKSAKKKLSPQEYELLGLCDPV
jgi:hypothetical protein